MKTVVLGPRPAELEALIDRRRRLGIDRFDELWEGVYHMAPAPHSSHGLLDDELAVVLRPLALRAGLVGTGQFNLGQPDDYRVPDRGHHRSRPSGIWLPTAAVVVEIVAPDDETYEKFGFYAAHGVDELVVADPAVRTVRIFRLDGEAYVETPASELLAVDAPELTQLITWP